MSSGALAGEATRLLHEHWPADLDPITEDQTEKLGLYLELLNQWNKVHSLTAVLDLKTQVFRHLLDALIAWKALPHRLCEQPDLRVADIGSGMGVPGVVWAVVMPQSRFDLIERQHKKAAFLTHVLGRLGLSDRVRVVGQDVRDVRAPEPYGLICSRAFAALEDFLQLTWHLSGPQTIWAAMMGRATEIKNKKNSEQTLFMKDTVQLSQLKTLKVPGTEADRHLALLKRVC